MSKPTIVVVPGAWQKPVAFEKLVKLLEQAGYPTVFVPLPTVGDLDAPLADLNDDVEAVRKALVPLVDEGKEVVMIGHSAGGISMSGATEGLDVASRKAQGKQGGVARCIFMAAFVLPKGQSLLGVLGGQPLPWMVIEGDRVRGDPAIVPDLAFSDLSPEDRGKWAKEMTYTSAALFASSALYEPWANGVACSYIFTADDGAIPLAVQQGLAQQLGPEAKTASLKANHSPHVSMPEELVKAIESVI